MRRIRLFGRECGGALIEFAIVVPVLLLILFAIIDFARMLLTKNSLVNAVREGSRYGAVQPIDAASWPATQTAIQSRVRSRITTFGGSPTDAGSALVVTTPVPGPGNSYEVTVTVLDFPYRPLTPVLSMIHRGAIRLNASARFRSEWATASY